MSQRRRQNIAQLKLVFVNSLPRTKPLKIKSLPSKKSPAVSSTSRLAQLAVQLQHERPDAAAFIEKLVEDLLNGGPRHLPPLE